MSRRSSTRFSREWLARLARLALLAAACLVALAFAEVATRIYFSVRQSYDMEMWKYAVELKRETSDARSHVHVPLSHARLMGVEVAINSKGLRDREYDYGKPPGSYRILAIGDSETMGWGVPLEETFPKLLEKKLHREVLNFGVGNYNTEQELAAFEIEGVRFHPDAVLLFIFINDAEPVQKHAFNVLTAHSYFYALLASRIVQLRSYFDERGRFVAYYDALYEGASWQRYARTLRAFVEETRRRGVRLVPVLIPEMRCLEDYPFRLTIHEKIRGELARYGVPLIDLLPAFEGKSSSEYMVARDDSHPNAKAHALIADEVFRQLRERKLLP